MLSTEEVLKSRNLVVSQSVAAAVFQPAKKISICNQSLDSLIVIYTNFVIDMSSNRTGTALGR